VVGAFKNGSRESPASGSSPLWQSTQNWISTGATCFSKEYLVSAAIAAGRLRAHPRRPSVPRIHVCLLFWWVIVFRRSEFTVVSSSVQTRLRAVGFVRQVAIQAGKTEQGRRGPQSYTNSAQMKSVKKVILAAADF